jgi:glycosyltransferase involved in cell wall biosynthesis
MCPLSSPRHKVVFFIPAILGGGIERVFLTLLRHISRKDFELHIASHLVDRPFLSAVPEDVAVHFLKAARLRYIVPGLVRLIWQIRPQTVLSGGYGMNLALMAAQPFLPRGIRLVVRESTTPSAHLQHRAKHPQLESFLCRRLYRRADRVVCLSDSMADDLVEQFQLPRNKLVRIYNPIDLALLRELGETPLSPYAGPGPHIVAVARLSREKGLDILLDASALARKRIPNLQLTVIGSGPREGELLAQSSKLGLTDAVRFLGFQLNPWPYMRHADLYVLPSRYEGLSNSLLEALALGTPVVATDCPGAIREVYASNPTLCLVPTEDPLRLADAIVAACRQPKPLRVPIKELPTSLVRFDLQPAVDAYSALLMG